MSGRNFFDFYLESPLLYPDKEIDVKFDYLLEGYSKEDFVVRVDSENNIFELYNPQLAAWISNGSLWTEFPTIEKDIKIRMTNAAVTSIIDKKSIKLGFSIQNRKTGEIYITPEKQLFTTLAYENYISKINENLVASENVSNLYQSTSELAAPVIYKQEVSSAQERKEYFSKIPVDFLLSTLFILAAFVILGIKIFVYLKRDRISKWNELTNGFRQQF